DGKIDWTQVALGSAGAPPLRATLVLLSAREGLAAARAAVEGSRGGELKQLGPQGGLVAVDEGNLVWAGYDAGLLHERRYTPGQAPQDAVHVDLSTREHPCLLHVFWPPGSPGSKDAALEVARAFVPRPVAPEPTR